MRFQVNKIVGKFNLSLKEQLKDLNEKQFW